MHNYIDSSVPAFLLFLEMLELTTWKSFLLSDRTNYQKIVEDRQSLHILAQGIYVQQNILNFCTYHRLGESDYTNGELVYCIGVNPKSYNTLSPES